MRCLRREKINIRVGKKIAPKKGKRAGNREWP